MKTVGVSDMDKVVVNELVRIGVMVSGIAGCLYRVV